MTLLDRVKILCKEKGISQGKMEKEMGISNGASSKWKTSSPSMEILQKLSEYFNVSVDYLMTGKDKSNSNESNSYYLNDDARDMAQFLYENPDYKVLFDASRKVKKEDIEFVKQMIERVNGNT